MATYAIDFETYYSDSCTIRNGLYNYTHNPEYETYLVSVVGPGTAYSGPPSAAPWDRIGGPGNTWISHNRSFDMGVYLHERSNGVPWACYEPPGSWHCTADLAAWSGAPRSLAGAASAVLGQEVDKGTRAAMKGKRWADMPEDFRDEVTAYALKDSETCLALWEGLSDRWPEHERRLSFHTSAMGWRGLPLDRPALDKACERLRDVLFDAEKGVPWAGTAPILSARALADECRKAGIEPPASLAMDSPECEAWEDEHGSEYPWVAHMRDFRRGNMLLKKLETMAARLKGDGFTEYSLKYFGAHTGRWSGGDGSGGEKGRGGSINYQNLPRGELMGVDLRSIIRAPEGHVFVVADLSQIEPRCLSLMAGDEGFLERMRSGEDVYEAHARQTLGYVDPRPLKDVDPDLRRLSKARALGLGYGCGPDKFVTVAKVLAGLDIDPEESRRIVASYRASSPKVTALWRRMGLLLRNSIGGPMTVTLPSGRDMVYRDVRLRRRIDEETGVEETDVTAVVPLGGKLARVRTHGPRIVENLVQATARDVFAHLVLAVEDAGYDVALHVHDEVVALVEEGRAEKALADILSIMSVPPPWMPGLPLAAEGKITRRYTK